MTRPADQPTAGAALKPCPFCGGPAKTFSLNGTMQAQCAKDFKDCAGSDVVAPLAMWNTRTPASGPVEADDRLAVAVEALTPFATEAANWSESVWTDEKTITSFERPIVVGDLRRASEALALLTSGEAGV